MKIRKCKYNILSGIGGVCIFYDHTHVAEEELESIHTTHEAILFVENVRKSWKTFFFRIFFSTFLFFFCFFVKVTKTHKNKWENIPNQTRRKKEKGKMVCWMMAGLDWKDIIRMWQQDEVQRKVCVCVFGPSCRDDVLFNKLKLFKDLWNSWWHCNRRGCWWGEGKCWSCG